MHIFKWINIYVYIYAIYLMKAQVRNLVSATSASGVYSGRRLCGYIDSNLKRGTIIQNISRSLESKLGSSDED